MKLFSRAILIHHYLTASMSAWNSVPNFLASLRIGFERVILGVSHFPSQIIIYDLLWRGSSVNRTNCSQNSSHYSTAPYKMMHIDNPKLSYKASFPSQYLITNVLQLQVC